MSCTNTEKDYFVESEERCKGGTISLSLPGLKKQTGVLYDDLRGGRVRPQELAGAGSLSAAARKRLKADPKGMIHEKSGMLRTGVYEIPEVRKSTPGHLVRCGGSSAFDVTFGTDRSSCISSSSEAGRRNRGKCRW